MQIAVSEFPVSSGIVVLRLKHYLQRIDEELLPLIEVCVSKLVKNVKFEKFKPSFGYSGRATRP